MIDRNNSLPQLADGWVWTTLRGISEDTKNAIVDGPFGSQMKVHEFTSVGVPVIEMQNLKGRQLDLSFRRFITETKFEEVSRSKVKANDLIISKTGTLGLISIVPQKVNKAIITSRLAKISLDQRLVSLTYAYYFLIYLRFNNYWEEVGKGTTMRILTIANIANTSIPLPPLPEQHRIVTKIEELFTRLDAGIESLKELKVQIKRYRQALLKHALEGKLTKEWREAQGGQVELSSVTLERLKEEQKKSVKGNFRELQPLGNSDLPEIPEGWVWIRVNWLCDTQTGPFGTQLHRSDYVDIGIPTIEIGDVHPDRDLGEGTRHFISEKKASELRRFEVKTGDILFSRIGTVGRCTLVPSRCDGWIMSTSLIRVRVISDYLLPKYLLLYFRSPISQYYTRKTSIGTTRAGTNSKIVGDLPLILPPISEQHRIIEEIERYFSIASEIEKIVEQSITCTSRLRQSILKRAFEGELVPQDPSDEPAEKLLERIKGDKTSSDIREKSVRKTDINARKTRSDEKIRKPTATNNIYDILKSIGRRLTPEELLELSKLTIEDFYKQLEAAIRTGRIVEKRPNNIDVFLEVAE